MGQARRNDWRKRLTCEINSKRVKLPLTVISVTRWHPVTCECRMGELAGGFHPGGISAPLPASAGGCRVVVTVFYSEEYQSDR